MIYVPRKGECGLVTVVERMKRRDRINLEEELYIHRSKEFSKKKEALLNTEFFNYMRI